MGWDGRGMGWKGDGMEGRWDGREMGWRTKEGKEEKEEVRRRIWRKMMIIRRK